MVAFTNYLEGRKPEFNLDPQRVTSSGLHGWNDRVFITVSGTLPNEQRNIRRARSKLHVSLGALFQEWQKGGETYEQAFKREKAAYARSVLNGYVADIQKRMQVITGRLPATLDNVLGSVNGSLISGMEYAATMRGFSHDKALAAIKEFAASGAMNETPATIVSAAMWASLAMQAAAGQKKIPDEGMVTDIDVISALLPYCDAMFVDNKCRSLLSEIPKRHKLPYKCLVFSSKTSDQFLQYLQDICSSATPEHLELLQEVYGPGVLEPPKSIYGVGAPKRTGAG